MNKFLLIIITLFITTQNVLAYVIKLRGPSDEALILGIGLIGAILGVSLFVYSTRNNHKSWAYTAFRWSITITISSIGLMIVAMSSM